MLNVCLKSFLIHIFFCNTEQKFIYFRECVVISVLRCRFQFSWYFCSFQEFRNKVAPTLTWVSTCTSHFQPAPERVTQILIWLRCADKTCLQQRTYALYNKLQQLRWCQTEIRHAVLWLRQVPLWNGNKALRVRHMGITLPVANNVAYLGALTYDLT